MVLLLFCSWLIWFFICLFSVCNSWAHFVFVFLFHMKFHFVQSRFMFYSHVCRPSLYFCGRDICCIFAVKTFVVFLRQRSWLWFCSQLSTAGLLLRKCSRMWCWSTVKLKYNRNPGYQYAEHNFCFNHSTIWLQTFIFFGWLLLLLQKRFYHVLSWVSFYFRTKITSLKHTSVRARDYYCYFSENLSFSLNLICAILLCD